jgi:PIN domain nuclease of toxin-antitoxin system
MRFLIDTHVLLWWWAEPGKLSPRVIALMREPKNEVFVSAASAWEIATKHRIGKLPTGGRMIAHWQERLAADGFRELPMTSNHALRAGSLIGEHRDPFDRMLASQSLIEGMPVASIDTALSGLGAERLWQ